MENKEKSLDIKKIKDELYTFAEDQKERDMLITISKFDKKHSEMIFRNLYEKKKNSFKVKRDKKIDDIKKEKWENQFRTETENDCIQAWDDIYEIFRYKKYALGLSYGDPEPVDTRGTGLMYRFHMNTLPLLNRALKHYKEHITNEKYISYTVKFPIEKVKENKVDKVENKEIINKEA